MSKARSASAVMRPRPVSSPVPARPRKRSMSMRRPTIVAAKPSARSDCVSSPRTDCVACATSALNDPDSRVATSAECTRCRSRSRTTRFQRLAPPSAGRITRPVILASPARRASMSSSASSRPFQRNGEFSDASGTREASSAPALALVAASVPAKPSGTARASSVTDSRVDGSAGAKTAMSTSFASTCASASGVAANGVSVAFAVTAALRMVPFALKANVARLPLAETSARVSRYAASPVKLSAAPNANGVTAASSASPDNVPTSVTKRRRRTECSRAPPL